MRNAPWLELSFTQYRVRKCRRDGAADDFGIFEGEATQAVAVEKEFAPLGELYSRDWRGGWMVPVRT